MNHQKIIWRKLATASAGKASSKIRKLAVEEEFQRLTPLEHILKCPNMYIGATSMTEKTKNRFLVSNLTAKTVKLERSSQPYIPGLVKLFDEVLVNACDNAVRDPLGTTSIDVTYDSKTGSFTVRNSGQGIPVKLHQKEKIYIPELVLGHLLTGSNFEKAEANSTGGRHGYGAKLCNVFSTRFTVETLDSDVRAKFVKKWKDNMTPDGDAEITKVTASEKPFTLVSFTPDWKRFGLRSMDSGSLAMIKTRVVETAGLLGPKVAVSWNGRQVPVHSFEDYCKSCYHEKPDRKLMFVNPNAFLRVGIGLSDDGFVDSSFVNSMSTWRGGSHVDAIVSQIAKKVMESMKKSDVTEREIKRHLQVFVDFRTNHPEFDSQSKERLTSNVADDQNIVLPEAFLKKFVKESGVCEALQASTSAKMEKALNKRVATYSIPKLEDALRAGSSRSDVCTLIVTEGDSAKALAMEGISVVGRDLYGVYPLRGKVLNVRDKSMQDVAENKEILNIINTLGLKVGMKTTSDLRYGRVMFMTDQDHDGSHIKGLLLNFFDMFWPELAQKPGFLTQFLTPLLKAKPRNSSRTVVDFFSQSEFEQWAKLNPNYGSEYKIKYYKGLGTSTAQEAREYFSNLSRHVVDFSFSRGQLDRELLDKIFKAERSQERKEWLRTYRGNQAATLLAAASSPTSVSALSKKQRSGAKGTSVNPTPSVVAASRVQTVESFINTDFAAFSWHDVERSIPSLFDGLKPSQRKVFYALLEKSRSTTDEIKVAQLSGYVAEVTSYHHGEKSLVDTIVNMAQDFVGANNLPLLRSEGQFGTRSQGGKDAAAGRYIFTGLSPIARLLFPHEDDRLLARKVEDGNEVEPKWYIPIVPLVLINGCEGIGTGWSSFVPAHHPLDVADAVEKMIHLQSERGQGKHSNLTKADVFQAIEPLVPWYKGYTGNIVHSGDRFECHGRFHVVKAGTDMAIEVKELPLGMWTEDFKEKLTDHIKDQKLREYKDESEDPSKIHFKLYPTNPTEYFEKDCARFRSFLDMRNMNLFDSEGKVERFSDAREILHVFFSARLELYSRRRANIIHILNGELQNLIRERDLTRKVVSMEEESSTQQVQLLGKSSNKIHETLGSQGFTKLEIDRMLKKPIGEFTLEKVIELEKSLVTKKKTLDRFLDSTSYSLWLEDLAKFRGFLDNDVRFERTSSTSSSTKARVSAG